MLQPLLECRLQAAALHHLDNQRLAEGFGPHRGDSGDRHAEPGGCAAQDVLARHLRCKVDGGVGSYATDPRAIAPRHVGLPTFFGSANCGADSQNDLRDRAPTGDGSNVSTGHAEAADVGFDISKHGHQDTALEVAELELSFRLPTEFGGQLFRCPSHIRAMDTAGHQGKLRIQAPGVLRCEERIRADLCHSPRAVSKDRFADRRMHRVRDRALSRECADVFFDV
ncbi:di-heme oxidoredictase family protein [Rhizobium ruizarguesonis]